ncbi:MAG: type IV pilus assembly protein PilM [Sedimentisphaerales bacterium]|nr:type IV pilus assembly protein PilM [Sedimentisphaerales bacterium]
MAEKIGSVWAVDIGNTSLKALRLSNESGALEVIGFDCIPHGKILSGTGIKDQEKQELIALSLRQFVQQNDIAKDEIIVAVPSLNSFSRFVNLPPVEKKRIPEIVKFEATQQIPFDINEVSWDWQMMTGEEAKAGEAKVGIFAIKNDVVMAELEHFGREDLQVSYVQIAQMALYNYLYYDRPDLMKSDTQATVILNIGAENTDLVVCTRSNVWQRTIAMGGNAFTKAIADTFKLSFEKAEKLKRTAPMSKYARQILQAMKPVFADLASEIQRSLGFYTSANPSSKLARIVALGGGTKMRGLLQYLQQSLQLPIERPDAFKRVALNASVSAAKFHENVSDFGIVYGLAVQSLGLAAIEINLLPRSVARSMVWASKTKYFVAAACMILLASVLALARTIIDQSSYKNKSAARERTKMVINEAQRLQSEFQQEQARASSSQAVMNKTFDLFNYRDVLPLVNQTIIEMLPNEKTNPLQESLYEAFNRGDVESIRTEYKQRDKRKQIFIASMSVYYSLDLPSARFSSAGLERAIDEGRGAKRTGEVFDEAAFLEAMYGKQAAESFKKSQQEQQRAAAGETAAVPEGQGFVVTIAGFSPYREIAELFDPAGAKDDPNKWGIVTRLMNLDSMFDGNSPFELFDKNDVKNFELKTGPVDLKGEMPRGIGVQKKPEGKDAELVLIDPMTKEVISKEPVFDEAGKKATDRTGNTIYKTNDQWFVLNFKLKWKDAPQAAGAESATTTSSTSAASSPSNTPSGGGGKSSPKNKGIDKLPGGFD